MADRAQSTDETTKPEGAPTPPPPKRGLGHRGADPRDTAAELAARAHQISLEAGSRMAGAMRNLIHAAAGLGDFSIDTARDVVNFMVRRGQMAQEEAEKLIREAEVAVHRDAASRPPAPAPSSDTANTATAPAAPAAAPTPAAAQTPAPAAATAAPPAAAPAAPVPAEEPETRDTGTPA
jgi:hypothetical protein